jgi:hypothetical protein
MAARGDCGKWVHPAGPARAEMVPPVGVERRIPPEAMRAGVPTLSATLPAAPSPAALEELGTLRQSKAKAEGGSIPPPSEAHAAEARLRRHARPVVAVRACFSRSASTMARQMLLNDLHYLGGRTRNERPYSFSSRVPQPTRANCLGSSVERGCGRKATSLLRIDNTSCRTKEIRKRADGCVRTKVDRHRAFQQKEAPMKRAPVFVLAMVGLAFAGPVLGETIKLQIKGAY